MNLIIFTPKAISVSTPEKISAVVITKNEGAIIEKFLDQLSFVDQIVLVDSGSADDTVEKAKKFKNVSVFTRPFDNFSAQKNFGIDQVKHPWVLFFDPDEAVIPSLKNEILEAVTRGDKDAYFVRRQLYFMGKKSNTPVFKPIGLSDWAAKMPVAIMVISYTRLWPLAAARENSKPECPTIPISQCLIISLN